jgi:acetyltransferase-like isoleucine patch superfamily enzyme
MKLFLVTIRHAYKVILAKIWPVYYAKSLGVKINSGVKFFSLHPGAFGSEPYLISIGRNVVITAGVRFITHDGSTFLFRDKYRDLDVMGPITIGDNTFIGMGSVILPGVTIGKNCIIGSMSVISGPIPEGSVVAGNPAKILSSTDQFLDKLINRSCGTGNLSPEDKRKELERLPRMLDSRGRVWVAKDQ